MTGTNSYTGGTRVAGGTLVGSHGKLAHCHYLGQ